MSYTPKQQGTGGSGGQSSQQAKTLAGITQQMQNLVHGQNALPQAAQAAGLGAFANLNMTLQHQQQQQRIESIIREQQLLFSTNPQFQQHFQQQMQQNAAKEPLALTRSPADLLNKMQHHQQQANGSTPTTSLASNLTNQQLQQQLQAFSQNPANLMQQIQAYQYQMQQQNKQKMLSLNQAQQSLTTLQAQSVAQQHMQQIQQTLHQQQQKLMASHTKNLSTTGNQMKTSSVPLNTQGTAQPVPPNNNLPNKSSSKSNAGTSSQQSKQNLAQGPTKSVSNTNFNKNPGHLLGTPKAISPQLGGAKPSMSPKTQINTVPLTKTLLNKPPTPPIKSATVTSSSSPTKTNTSPSSSPLSANVSSASITRPGSAEMSVKTTLTNLVLTAPPSQVTSITTPLVASPKPTTPPAAPIAPVESQTTEQKKIEEIKQSEEILAVKTSDNQTSIEQKDQSEPVKMIETEIENTEKKTVTEKHSVALQNNKEKENEESKTQNIPDKDKSKNEIICESTNSENLSSIEGENTPLENTEEPSIKSEESATKNSTQKTTIKIKSNQKKGTTKSDSGGTPEKNQKEIITKIEKKKSPSTKIFHPEKNPKISGTPEIGTINDERRSQRHRLKTILYQSPLPELAFIAKLSANEACNSPKMINDEKLTIFYKNEYLAVRNAEGGFFLCQTLQNVYKTSPRIRIRWLSEEKKDSNIYIPDFYDNTDIECVLTTVEMEKVNKSSFRLPQSERIRIENILRKAIDVEKGVLPRPDVTEENPDGLDISLYKNESQIEKKITAKKRKLSVSGSGRNRKGHMKGKSLKRKKKSKPKKGHGPLDSNEEEESEDETDNDKEYKPSQKKNLLTTQPKPRAQRSPLAKARAASPISIGQELSPRTRRTVPQKSAPNVGKNEGDNEVSSSVTSRSDRAKRRTAEIILDKPECEVPAKKMNLMSNQSKKNEYKASSIKAKTNKNDLDILAIQESKNASEALESGNSRHSSKETVEATTTTVGKSSKTGTNLPGEPRKSIKMSSPGVPASTAVATATAATSTSVVAGTAGTATVTESSATTNTSSSASSTSAATASRSTRSRK